jgi:hypothetical protein
MKISYRTHPVIKRVEKEKDIKIPFFFSKTERESAEANKRLFNKAYNNIQVLSDPFIKALELSREKLYKQEYFDEIKNVSGMLISGNRSYLYDFIDQDNIHLVVFNCDAPFLFARVINGSLSGWITPDFKSSIDKNQILNYEVSDIVTTLIFIKYAEIDTKELPANKKQAGINCKYINDTSSNIKYLNITWFTNLVKSDGFNVRGHFRLQPKKKEGKWTKELIWINEFQKEGYTRRAGKIIENV